jgi:CheY-like chemotaxis protein
MGGGAPPSADRPPLVLVIDDDEMVRIVLQQILEHAGYRVVLTDDGRAGLAAVIEHAPDLVITDIIMPEMSGLDVIRALAQTDNAPPIIAISGGTRLDDRDALRTAIELGAVAICEKPFDPDDLLTLVRTHAGDVPDTGDGDQARPPRNAGCRTNGVSASSPSSSRHHKQAGGFATRSQCPEG